MKKKYVGHIKNPCVFIQYLIELFTPTNRRVVDLTCFIGVSIVATRACEQHLLAFEGDSDILEHVLKPLLEFFSRREVIYGEYLRS